MIKDIVPVKWKRIIKEGYNDFCDFGIKVMFARMYCTIVNDTLGGVQYKNKIVLDYLKRKYSHIIKKYESVLEANNSNQNENSPIWVFWWQGYNNMPDIIKMCHESKVRNSGGHPVILLTQENINDYIQFPDCVWSKFNEKILRIQHLADMIRVQLIQKYGGIWLDASIFCGREIPSNIFQMPLYSLKGEVDEYYVSRNQWTTFVIGGFKENVLCSFLNEFFLEYCKNEKRFIDYFMFDCAIQLAYQNIPVIKESIENLPKIQEDYYWLNSKLEEVVTESLLQDLEKKLPLFSKIAWGRKFENQKNDDTVYTYLLKKEGIINEKS